MKIVSLFSGCGGLDLGFEKAGFKVIWANEYDKNFWATYRHNFPKTHLETRSITDIKAQDIPDCDGIIGGPPCQSWSAIGSHRGIEDERGQLFLNDYVRIIKAKKPKFFLAENVPGMMYEKHAKARNKILNKLKNLGYNISYQLLNTFDYDVPQTRKRMIMVGYASGYETFFYPPASKDSKLTLRNQIFDIYKKYPKPPKVKTGEKVHTDLAVPIMSTWIQVIHIFICQETEFAYGMNPLSPFRQAEGMHHVIHRHQNLLKKLQKLKMN